MIGQLKIKKENNLFEKKIAFEKKEVLRNIYKSWYLRIKNGLRDGGKTLEIGSGFGDFKKFYGDCITSDFIESNWIDLRLDAQSLPFKDKTLANIVGIDVLHHLCSPESFFKEAERALISKGRIIFVEMYMSLVSSTVLKFFHFEDFLMNSFATNLFFGDSEKYSYLSKDFKIINKCIHDFLIYPLSGGFNYPSIIPSGSQFLFEILEKHLGFLRPVCAFKATIILEKKA